MSVLSSLSEKLLHVGILLAGVREQDEWGAGHAPNTDHHPPGRLAASMDRLPTERTLVVVGRSAKPSVRATGSLTKAELDAVSLTGSPTRCQAPGRPILNRREKDQ